MRAILLSLAYRKIQEEKENKEAEQKKKLEEEENEELQEKRGDLIFIL
jgi:hypothetical protein